MVSAYSTRSVGIFPRRTKVFARESAMLKSKLEEEIRRVKEGGKGGWKREEKESIFSPLPLPLSFFRPSP